MTLAEYWAEVERLAGARRHWRYGQTAFNVLAEYKPELSLMVRGQDEIDPFYLEGRSAKVLSDNKTWLAFCSFIADNWG